MSNLHSKQTGTNLHLPKRHKEAPTNSIISKTTSDEGLKYIGSNKEVSLTLTPVADSSGSLNNKYFSLWTKHNTKRYCVWFNVAGNGTLTLPDNYDALLEVGITTNETVAVIIDNIKTAIEAISSTEHLLYKTITDNTTNLAIVNQACSLPGDYDTGFTFSSTGTNITEDEILVAESGSGNLTFAKLNEKVADVVGTMVTGNTETDITVTYDDADNTLDFAVTGGGGNAFTTINCPSGTDPVADSASDTLNLTAGSGITITGNSTSDTITIASTAVLSQTYVISDSKRFETSNLALDAGAHYTFGGEHTTKSGMVQNEVTPSGFTSPISLRGAIYVRPNQSGTYTFRNCSSIVTGTSGASVLLALYKASPCGSTEYAGTLVASGSHDLTGNGNNICTNWTLAEGSDIVLAVQDVLIFTISMEEGSEDLDCRGVFTYEIETSTT